MSGGLPRAPGEMAACLFPAGGHTQSLTRSQLSPQVFSSGGSYGTSRDCVRLSYKTVPRACLLTKAGEDIGA